MPVGKRVGSLLPMLGARLGESLVPSRPSFSTHIQIEFTKEPHTVFISPETSGDP